MKKINVRTKSLSKGVVSGGKNHKVQNRKKQKKIVAKRRAPRARVSESARI